MGTDNRQPARYQADLSEATVPEILYSIDRFRVPGVIEATDREITQRVYVREGYVVHASSTDRGLSLGAYLYRSGGLDRDAYRRLQELRGQSTSRFGTLLIEEGFLSPEEVYAAIREQLEEIVWSLFSWSDGTLSFSPGDERDPEAVQIGIPLKQVILRGIRRLPDARILAARLGARDTVLEPSYRVDDLVEIGLDAEDFALLQLVDGKRTVYEICVDGPRSVEENAKLLYAFRVLHLVS